MGQAFTGAGARLETTPAANAMAMRCHPQASTTEWAARRSFTRGSANYDELASPGGTASPRAP